MNCSQAYLEATGNSPCKSRARWVKTQNQKKSKAWFLLLWWEGMLFISLCLLGGAMKWINTRVMSEWVGERAIKETRMKEVSQYDALRTTSAPICGSYFLSILLAIVVLSVWRRGRKVLEDKFDLYLHSNYECRSMTNLNTDFKGFNPETTASATMVPSGHPLGKLDTFLSQHIPAAAVPTNELYSKI